MNKPVCIFQAPVATRSGYGDMARGLARHLIELDMFDLKIISVPWGQTPMNALDESDPLHEQILQRMVQPPVQLSAQPDVFIHGVIPNEFMNPAKVNIGYTAGIETNMCSEEWLKGCNRMNVVWGLSNHAVNSLKNTTITKKNAAGQIVEQVSATTQFDVLHNYVDTDVFKKISPDEIEPTVDEMMAQIPEKFCFLFVGQWVKGGYGEDRKNIGVLIKTFCDTFKNKSSSKRPALILKTSGADFSILDRESIIQKIEDIKAMCGPVTPRIYLIHGELTNSEMNSLYNHPKIKAHISFTKGEGFGRPLLEATMSEKPLIVTGWSGHVDFLNPEDAILLAGELKEVEPGAVWDKIIIPQSKWFNVDESFASRAMKLVFEDYKRFEDGARRLAAKNREQFNSDAMKQRTKELIEKYCSSVFQEQPKMVSLQMPKINTGTAPTQLTSVGAGESSSPPKMNSLKLPTLKKIGE